MGLKLLVYSFNYLLPVRRFKKMTVFNVLL